MGSDDKLKTINQRIYREDIECLREELTCVAKQGIKFPQTFRHLLSFCLENKPKLKKWIKKKNQR